MREKFTHPVATLLFRWCFQADIHKAFLIAIIFAHILGITTAGSLEKSVYVNYISLQADLFFARENKN